MTEPEVVELLAGVRSKWKADLSDADHVQWRRELELVTYEAARQALRSLHLTKPHHRPSIETFREAVHEIEHPNRLSDDQIERNRVGVQRMRDAWNNRHKQGTAT